MQALGRRMLALGRMPERRENAEEVSVALLDKYEAVMRKFHQYRIMATKIQSLFRGRKVRKWFVGTLVAETFREISNDGAQAFYVDTRTG